MVAAAGEILTVQWAVGTLDVSRSHLDITLGTVSLSLMLSCLRY